jgi:hypothetical protein
LAPPNVSNPFCNADTALPVEPRASLGVCWSAGSAFQVIGPTTPSAVRLPPCWNDLTALGAEDAVDAGNVQQFCHHKNNLKPPDIRSCRTYRQRWSTVHDPFLAQRAPLYFTNLRSLSGEPAKIGKKVGRWLAGDRFDQLKRREFR